MTSSVWISAVVSVLSASMCLGLHEIIEGPNEYCSFEHFNATCEAGHVLVVVSARYGRMRIGKCVLKDLGYVGCVAEVRDVLDRRCTGRQACDISVGDAELRAHKPCPNDVTWHLEVAYKCVPVLIPADQNPCHYNLQNPSVQLNSTHYVSSVVSGDTGHGSTGCPWRLMARDGQTLAVSLYNTLPKKSGSGSNVCYTVGVATESQKSTTLTVCPDVLQLADTVVIYTSKSKTVDLSFYNGHQNAPYLMKVDVVGCQNLTIPAHATARRTQHKLEVTCNDAENSWTMYCQDNRWLGTMGNCTQEDKPWGTMGHIFKDGNILPMGILIAVALGVALGIFLGGLLLVIVGSRMKKKQRQRMQQAAFVDAPDYDVREETPQRFPAKSPGGGTLSSTMEYTLSRGTDCTTISEGDRPYTYRKAPTYPRDGEQLKCCSSPYHAYESPTMT